MSLPVCVGVQWRICIEVIKLINLVTFTFDLWREHTCTFFIGFTRNCRVVYSWHAAACPFPCPFGDAIFWRCWRTRRWWACI